MSYGNQGVEIVVAQGMCVLVRVCECVCVCLQRQPNIDHIHSCKTMLGNLPASLTGVLVGLILLAPLCFSFFSFSHRGAVPWGAVRVTGVSADAENADKDKGEMKGERHLLLWLPL